jgi:hypothetical protein
MLLSAAGYLFLQRYLVYSADGVYLDLPFLRTEAEKTAGTGAGDDELPPLQVAEPEQEEEPEELPSAEPRRIQAVFASPDELSENGLSDALRVRMEEAGANTLILDMKAEDGSLGFVSVVPLAAGAAVNASDEAVNDAIRAAADEEDLWLVASLSCFRDNAIPKENHKLSIMTDSGYRWYDKDFIGWMNPYNEEAQDYLISLAKELAALGFDEIRLTNCGFPIRGKVRYISYGADAATPFAEAVDKFLLRMREALADTGVRLSVLSDTDTILDGKNDLSGQTLTSLAAAADRIYVPCAPEDLAALTEAVQAAAPEHPDRFFVAVVSEAPETTCSWSLEPG